MDYDELVQEVQDLKAEVERLKNDPSKEAMESVRRSILDREIGTGQFKTTDTISITIPDGGGTDTDDVTINKLFDTGIITDLDGSLFVLGAYKYRP